MKKIQAIARTLDRAAWVLFWICLAFAGVYCAGMLLLAVHELTADASSVSTAVVSQALTLGNISFQVDPGALPQGQELPLALSGIAIVLCAAGFVCAVLLIFRRVLRPIAQARPFSKAVSGELRKLSWTVLIGGGLISVLQTVQEALFYRAYDFESLFLSDKILACQIHYRLDLSFLAVFALLYLLSFIFRYGEELQRLSDETL